MVRVVNRFKICVLAALVYLKAVALCLKTLKGRSQLVSSVIFVAILRQLMLLIFNKSTISLFQVVDLNIESMNGTL